LTPVGISRQEIAAIVAEGRLTEDFWDPVRTAAFLGVEEGTLTQWRHRRVGPRWYKPEGGIRYDPFDVRAYLLARASDAAA
jgi:hypothetical protein